MTSSSKPGVSDAKTIEGEGSYSGAKAYDDATREFIAKGKVAGAASEAKRAIQSAEGPELAEAEAKGKAHSMPEDGLKSKK